MAAASSVARVSVLHAPADDGEMMKVIISPCATNYRRPVIIIIITIIIIIRCY